MNNKFDSSNPYLSIVIPCRNDNYAGDMCKKLIISLTILIKQLNKFNLETEIIIVEWNPPKNKPKLSLEISKLKNLGKITIRIIEVNPSIHNSYVGSEKKGIVGSVALNVGIRRSHGKFITPKMSDTFFSDELIKFISKKSLANNCIYRTDRVDVNINLDLIDGSWQHYFNKNILYRGYYNKKGPHTKACGDFMLMNKRSWHSIRGFHEPKTVIGYGEDGEALYAALGLGLNQIYLDEKNCVYKIKHDNQHSERVKNKRKNFVNYLHFISDKYDSYLNFLKFKTILIYFFRFFLGIFNLPITKIHGLKVRSHYRWYFISLLRLKFNGLNFIGSKNWGLKLEHFDEITFSGDS